MPQRLLSELAGYLGFSGFGGADDSNDSSDSNDSEGLNGNRNDNKNTSHTGSGKGGQDLSPDRKGMASVMIAIFALLGLNITDIQDGKFYSTLGLGGLLAILILLQLSRDRDRSSKERERSDGYHNKMLTDYRALIVESTRANQQVVTLLESVVNEMRGQQQEQRDLLRNYHSTLSQLISGRDDGAHIGNHTDDHPGTS